VVLLEAVKKANDVLLANRIHAVNGVLRKLVSEQSTVLDQPLGAIKTSLLGKLTAKLVVIVFISQIVIEADVIRNSTILDDSNEVRVVSHYGPWTGWKSDPIDRSRFANIIEKQLVAHRFLWTESGLPRRKSL